MKLDAIAALKALYNNDSEQVVYLLNPGEITHQKLNNQVNNISNFLSNVEERLIAIHTINTHNAATLVLGSWLAGKTPVLLPNNLPVTVDRFVQNYDALFFDDNAHEQILDQTIAQADTSSICTSQLAFFTSGSTGEPILCHKNIGQLLAEVEQLEQAFGKKLNTKSVFCSGVSHQHIYGFLFKLLWPLLTQRQILSPCYNALNEISDFDKNLCWISSPAQLKRLQVKPNHDLNIDCVFSSGSSLEYNDALKCKELFNVYPYEVYGSTETGGIAFRQQMNPDQPYTSFDNVSIKNNGRGLLEIKSPYLPNQNWYEIQDKIELTSADSFILLGRTDRIVKIEGKRISLTEIEHNLCTSELCKEAFSIQLNRPNRQIIATAIALSETGRKFMANRGRKATIAKLSQELGQVVDPIMVPKRWRFLSDIPRNAQHKINSTEIQTYFDSPAHNTKPSILAINQSDTKSLYRLFVPRDLAYFHGHFPQLPILPGVVQIRWVLNLLQTEHGISQIKNLTSLKFNKPIFPGTDLELILEHKIEKQSFRFCFTTKQTSFSSGELLYTSTD